MSAFTEYSKIYKSDIEFIIRTVDDSKNIKLALHRKVIEGHTSFIDMHLKNAVANEAIVLIFPNPSILFDIVMDIFPLLQ